MGYRPVFRRQIGDPTTSSDGKICTLTSGAMALDYHTRGRLRKWGGELLATLDLTAAQVADGTNLGDLGRAWAAFGERLEDRTGRTWADLEAALAERRAVVLQGDYDQFSLATRCQDSLTDGHAILVLPERRGGRTLAGDPLCVEFTWIPDGELRAYAEKLGRSSGLGGRPQRIRFAVTRPRADERVAEGGSALDPVDHLPVAVCDVVGPLTVYADPDRAAVLIRSWVGAARVGLYARPAGLDDGSGRPALAPIRLDLVSGPVEDLRVGWVGIDRITNVRVG